MTAIHFSYYELSLLSFLRESHPEKADDIPFIKERAAAASEAYTEAFDAGLPITECIGIANKTLYAGLHFSRHDTISSVLWNEFSAEVSLEAVRDRYPPAPAFGRGFCQVSDFGRVRLYARIQLSLYGDYGFCPTKTRRRWQAITRRSI